MSQKLNYCKHACQFVMVLVTVVGSKKREVVRERKEQITEQQILKSSYGRSFGIVGKF